MCKKKLWFFADDEITDRLTDRTSYRDARAHLNIARKITINESINYLKDWNNNINSHARYFFMHSLAPSSSLPSPLSILWMWHCCTSSDKSRLMPYLFNCDSRHIENWTKIFDCPTSSGASEWARKRANERSGARTKWAVWSKRVSERCEWTSERMSKWLITKVPILRGSESQCIMKRKILLKTFSQTKHLINVTDGRELLLTRNRELIGLHRTMM